MKKRLLAIVLILALCLSLVACGSGNSKPTETTAPKKESVITPLLYKVSDNDGNVVWLFGSIHIGREDYDPLPDYVLDAYHGSDALAVELNLVAFEADLNAQMQVLQQMIYVDGTTIRDYIPEDLYNRAVKVLKDAGEYHEMLDYYMPCLWGSFVTSAGYNHLDVDINAGIDRTLLNMAKTQGKTILEVESAEFQYSMMMDYSPELQLLLLEESVAELEDLETFEASVNELMDIWARGDEEEFASYLYAEEELPEDVTEEELALYEEYEYAMITSRNANMTKYACDALVSGQEVFICVGAAHVVGPIGMAQQMRDLGYKVEIIQ